MWGEWDRARYSVEDFAAGFVHFDNGATGFMINSWSSGRRIFAVEMHAPGICVEAEHDAERCLDEVHRRLAELPGRLSDA